MKDPKCKECGEIIPRGMNESNKVHMKRQYCSPECREAGRRKSNHPWNTGFKGGEFYL